MRRRTGHLAVLSLLASALSGCAGPPSIEGYFLAVDEVPPGLVASMDAGNGTRSFWIPCRAGEPNPGGCALLGPPFPDEVRFQELRDARHAHVAIVAGRFADAAAAQAQAVRVEASVDPACPPGTAWVQALRDGAVLILVWASEASVRAAAQEAVATLREAHGGLVPVAAGCAAR